MKKIVVIGDIILDRYVYGEVTRTSPEAAIPILEESLIENRLGGAANVAKCIKYMGEDTVDVRLMGVVGTDDESLAIELLCFRGGINPYILHKVEGHCTTLKTRFMNKGNHLLRVDRESYLPYDVVSKGNVDVILDDISVVVISDYDKGALNLNTIKLIISCCNDNGIPIIVDPKYDNFWSYKNATVFKPNRKELTEALCHVFGQRIIEHNDIDADIFSMVREADTKLKCENYVVTDGMRGMSLVNNTEEHFDAEERNVIDVTGAGDMVTATIAYCMAMGNTLKQSVHYANKAAGLAVTQSGCGQVKYGEIIEPKKLGLGLSEN